MLVAVIPVFVSSTFADFNEERDALCGPVRDELDRRARLLGCTVDFVDLRWGVDTVSVSEAEAQQRVLGICLGEIERCRPLFIGLVGQRYGWVPGADAIGLALSNLDTTVGSRTRVDGQLDAMSITALEFEIALNSGRPAESVVFERVMLGEPDPRYCDVDTAASAEFRRRVSELIYPLHTVRFDAHVRGDRVVSGFEHVAIEAIWPLVEAAATAGAQFSVGDEYRLARQLRLDENIRSFIGRDVLMVDLLEQLEMKRHTVLVGPPGSGLTSIWLAATEILRQVGPVWDCLAGITPDTSTTSGLAANLLESGGRGAGLSPESELSFVLRELEHQTVLAIDNIEGARPSSGRDALEVVRRSMSAPNAQLFVSTHSGDLAAQLVSLGFDRFNIGPIERQAIPDVLAALVAPRELPDEAVAVLAAEDRGPQWLKLASRQLTTISAEDLANAQTAPQPGLALQQLVTRHASDLPADLASLVHVIMNKTCERVTPVDSGSDPIEIVRVCTAALAIARAGLRPSDLTEVCGQKSGPIVATVVSALGAVLGPAGPDHALMFQSAAVASAALEWAEQESACLHEKIASALAAQPVSDPLRSVAAAWHAILGGSGQLLHMLLDEASGADSSAARRLIADQLLEALESRDESIRDNANRSLRFNSSDRWPGVVEFLCRAYWERVRESDRSDGERPNSGENGSPEGGHLEGRRSKAISFITKFVHKVAADFSDDLAHIRCEAFIVRTDAWIRQGGGDGARKVLNDAIREHQSWMEQVGDSVDSNYYVAAARIWSLEVQLLVIDGHMLKMVRQIRHKASRVMFPFEGEVPLDVMHLMVDTYLLLANSLQAYGKLVLAEAATAVARDLWNECTTGIPDHDEWKASRALSVMMQALRITLYGEGYTQDTLEMTSGIAKMMDDTLRAQAPTAVSVAEHSIELGCHFARFYVDRPSDAKRHLGRSITIGTSLVEQGVQSNYARRWTIYALLMQAELRRADHDESWVDDIELAGSVYKTATHSLEKLVAYHLLDQHISGLMDLAARGKIKKRTWLRRTVIDDYRSDRYYERAMSSPAAIRVGIVRGSLVDPAGFGADPIAAGLRYVRSQSVLRESNDGLHGQ